MTNTMFSLNKLPIAKFTGGEGRIRTSEGCAGRFTVCSLWPLGNLSPASHRPGATEGNRTPDPLITNQLLCLLSYGGFITSPEYSKG